MKTFVLTILLLLSGICTWSQDSLPPSPPRPDSLPAVRRPVQAARPIVRPAAPDSTLVADSLLFPVRDLARIAALQAPGDTALRSHHPFFRFTDPVRFSNSVFRFEGKELLFYSLIALLIVFALIKNSFYRYLQDLFRIFFRTTAKQRQVREQLAQNPLPSLLFNLFFVISIGFFLALLLTHYRMTAGYNFWLLYAWCLVALVGIYGVKFLVLKFFGWVFQIADATDTYIFIVFTTNKVIGMFLLPFLVVLAFSTGMLNQVAFTLSISMVLGLLAYRFFLSYVFIHRQVQLSIFHFLLYLCAVEILPLLLINKLLFTYLGETH